MKKIVEINGVKMEIDTREAKTINAYKVGDRVKVLVKQYSEYKVFNGIIAGFNEFQNLPTISVAYLETSYNEAKINFVHINAQSKDYEIAPAQDYDIPFDKGDMIARMDREITKKEEEIKDLLNKKTYFLNNFGKFFEVVTNA